MAAKQSYIDSNGRLAIPAIFRQQLQLRPGDKVDISFTEEGLLISTYHAKLAKVRKLIKLHTNSDISLVDELLNERRREAAKEDAEFNNKNQADTQDTINE